MELVEQGRVRLGYVTQAPLTRIMNLLLLALKIEEAILEMGGDAVKRLRSKHDVPPIMKVADWGKQERAWDRLYSREEKRSADASHA